MVTEQELGIETLLLLFCFACIHLCLRFILILLFLELNTLHETSGFLRRIDFIIRF